MLIKPIHTARLIIDEIYCEDFSEINKIMNSNLSIFNYSAWNKIYSDQTKLHKFLLEAVSFQLLEPRNKYVFKVNHRQNKELIGTCSFFCSDLNNKFLSPALDQGDFRVAIAQDKQGEFYSLEIIEALLEFGFTELKKHRIVCYADKNNVALQLTLKRCGLQEEALCRKYMYRDNQWHDHYLYAILDRQWQKAKNKTI